MPGLTVRLPALAIEAFEQAARTLALAEPETDALALAARLLAVLVSFDVAEALAGGDRKSLSANWREPIQDTGEAREFVARAGAEAVSLELDPGTFEALEALAVRVGIEPAEAASRILAAVAQEGPAAALQAINSRRIGRRPRKDRG